MLKDYVQPTCLILSLISGVRTRKNSYSLNTIPDNTVWACAAWSWTSPLVLKEFRANTKKNTCTHSVAANKMQLCIVKYNQWNKSGMLVTAVTAWLSEKESSLMQEHLMFSSHTLICTSTGVSQSPFIWSPHQCFEAITSDTFANRFKSVWTRSSMAVAQADRNYTQAQFYRDFIQRWVSCPSLHLFAQPWYTGTISMVASSQRFAKVSLCMMQSIRTWNKLFSWFAWETGAWNIEWENYHLTKVKKCQETTMNNSRYPKAEKGISRKGKDWLLIGLLLSIHYSHYRVVTTYIYRR